MKHVYASLLALVFCFSLAGQNTFHYNFSPVTGGDMIDFRDMERLPDSGLVLLSYVGDYNSYNTATLIARTQANGDTLWTKNYYLGNAGLTFAADDIIRTSDSGFFMTGIYVDTTSVLDRLAMAKTDSLGNVQWAVYTGGTDHENGVKAIQLADGSFVVAGETAGNNTQAILLRIDANGNLLWKKYYWRDDLFEPVGLASWPDGTIALLNNNYSYAGSYERPVVMKVDLSGNLLWAKMVYSNSYDIPHSMLMLPGGKMLIGGSSNVLNNPSVFFIKTDSSASPLWMKEYGQTSSITPLNFITPAGNGFVFSTGSVGSFYPGGVIGRTDTSGNLLSVLQYDSIGIRRVLPGNDGGYTACTEGPYSFNNASMHFFRVDAAGYGECSGPGLPLVGTQPVAAMTQAVQPQELTGSGTVPFTLFTFRGCTIDNSCISTVDWTVGVPPSPEVKNHCSVYPQPSSGEIHFAFEQPLSDARLVITDALGRTVFTKEHFSGSGMQFETEQFPGGIYFYRVMENSYVVFTGKLLME